jgi:hypothetical protein
MGGVVNYASALHAARPRRPCAYLGAGLPSSVTADSALAADPDRAAPVTARSLWYRLILIHSSALDRGQSEDILSVSR